MFSSSIFFKRLMQPFSSLSSLSWSLMQSFSGIFQTLPSLCMVISPYCLILLIFSKVIFQGFLHVLFKAFSCSSSWFLQNFFQGIFSSLSNLKVSSSFHIEFESGCQIYILTQQHKPKPNSSMFVSQVFYLYQKSIIQEFSLLYILMLWFIVIQDLYYTLIY